MYVPPWGGCGVRLPSEHSGRCFERGVWLVHKGRPQRLFLRSWQITFLVSVASRIVEICDSPRLPDTASVGFWLLSMNLHVVQFGLRRRFFPFFSEAQNEPVRPSERLAARIQSCMRRRYFFRADTVST